VSWYMLCFCCTHKVCREEKAGRGYIGQVSTTASGKLCQQWSSNTPHVPVFTDDEFPDGSREAANNYCRNPDTSWNEGVWCYTMDPDVPREACNVPECGTSYVLFCCSNISIIMLLSVFIIL